MNNPKSFKIKWELASKRQINKSYQILDPPKQFRFEAINLIGARQASHNLSGKRNSTYTSVLTTFAMR